MAKNKINSSICSDLIVLISITVTASLVIGYSMIQDMLNSEQISSQVVAPQ